MGGAATRHRAASSVALRSAAGFLLAQLSKREVSEVKRDRRFGLELP